MIRIVFKFRKWWWYERIRGGVRLEQDLRKVKKHPFNLCIQSLDSFDDARPRFLCVTRFSPSEHRALLSERLDQPISTTITYPMKYWCILQKYIFQPLLLLQSVPCHHIVSEMYLQPSRPQMHANSASRQNSRFVPQATTSFLKSSNNLCCFPQ